MVMSNFWGYSNREANNFNALSSKTFYIYDVFQQTIASSRFRGISPETRDVLRQLFKVIMNLGNLSFSCSKCLLGIFPFPCCEYIRRQTKHDSAPLCTSSIEAIMNSSRCERMNLADCDLHPQRQKFELNEAIKAFEVTCNWNPQDINETCINVFQCTIMHSS